MIHELVVVDNVFDYIASQGFDTIIETVSVDKLPSKGDTLRIMKESDKESLEFEILLAQSTPAGNYYKFENPKNNSNSSD